MTVVGLPIAFTIVLLVGEFALYVTRSGGLARSIVWSAVSMIRVAPMALNVAVGVVVCVAGYLVRQRRKVGALLVVAAWALPTLISVLNGGGAKPGSIFLFAAMIGIALNWKHMR